MPRTSGEDPGVNKPLLYHSLVPFSVMAMVFDGCVLAFPSWRWAPWELVCSCRALNYWVAANDRARNEKLCGGVLADGGHVVVTKMNEDPCDV